MPVLLLLEVVPVVPEDMEVVLEDMEELVVLGVIQDRDQRVAALEPAIHLEDHWPMHDRELDAPLEVDRSVRNRDTSTRDI